MKLVFCTLYSSEYHAALITHDDEEDSVFSIIDDADRIVAVINLTDAQWSDIKSSRVAIDSPFYQ